MVPGLNGGYYLVQVRSLLNNGALAFPDMPLLFYLQGLLVKIIAWLMPALQPDQIIIFVAKFTDSIGLPLMLIPIYLIIRDFLKDKLSRTYELTMIGFLVLSGSPLMLTSDLQKNALAMPIMLFFIYYFLLFLRNKNKKQLLLTILFPSAHRHHPLRRIQRQFRLFYPWAHHFLSQKGITSRHITGCRCGARSPVRYQPRRTPAGFLVERQRLPDQHPAAYGPHRGCQLSAVTAYFGSFPIHPPAPDERNG
ncbi:MAG: hypothetical protein R2759_12555 [Bacteroidales bacterium]